jgi:hypothetical protein
VWLCPRCTMLLGGSLSRPPHLYLAAARLRNPINPERGLPEDRLVPADLEDQEHPEDQQAQLDREVPPDPVHLASVLSMRAAGAQRYCRAE